MVSKIYPAGVLGEVGWILLLGIPGDLTQVRSPL